MTNSNLLFLIAIPVLLVLAPTTTFALSNQNQTATATNETNQLLKQILEQQKLNTQLQQDNQNVQSIKQDILNADLERILVQLQAPPTLPPIIPPPPSMNFGQPGPPPSLNATICKERNDNGVLIQCPIFPGLEQQPSIPLSPPPPQLQQCGFMDKIWGVFC